MKYGDWKHKLTQGVVEDNKVTLMLERSDKTPTGEKLGEMILN